MIVLVCFKTCNNRLYTSIYVMCRSQWPRGLRRRSAAARLLGLWVRIPPEAWMFVCCECCVLSGRGLCDGLITRPEESYRLWYVIVCDPGTSKMRRPWPALGLQRHKKKIPCVQPVLYGFKLKEMYTHALSIKTRRHKHINHFVLYTWRLEWKCHPLTEPASFTASRPGNLQTGCCKCVCWRSRWQRVKDVKGAEGNAGILFPWQQLTDDNNCHAKRVDNRNPV